MAVTESKGDGYALYNGIKLPNIDAVWTDKETYPYANIFYVDAGMIDSAYTGCKHAELVFAANKLVVQSDGQAKAEEGKSIGYAFATGSFATDNGWVDGAWNLIGEANGSVSVEASLFTWASYDIINTTDNTVYLPASDPIPLDGMNVIEWDGVTEGMETFGQMVRIKAEMPSGQELESAVVVGYASAVSQSIVVPVTWQETNTGAYWGMVGEDIWIIAAPATDSATPGLWVASVDGVYISLFAYTPATTEEPETPAVKKFPLRKFILGILSELTAGSAKEPIAYLYNGVRLPKLPEWDRGVYPFAVISVTAPSLLIKHYTASLKFYSELTAGDAAITHPMYSGNGGIVYKITWEDGADAPIDSWGEATTYSDPVDANINMATAFDYIVWTNTDIVASDNSWSMAASDPIPVYE